MRTIDQATTFRGDYKRESKGQYRATLGNDLKFVLVALANDQALDAKYRDHDLSGEWAGYRECHIKNPNELSQRQWTKKAIVARYLGFVAGDSLSASKSA